MAIVVSDTGPGPRKGGGKLARSETVTVRLDPKLNYLCELAARAQRRTKSSFIEWAIDHALKSVTVPGGGWGDEESISAYASRLWDVDEVDRLIALAESAPVLMTHEEQLIWKVITQTGWFWKGRHDKDGDWTWTTDAGGCVAERVRTHWETIKAVADGRQGEGDLPKSSRKPPGGFPADFDDDVPF